ncbi:ribonuclease P protein subunit p25-like protein [Ditylenchus destructor]|uniref:Ribonuclease P protein subunit p25-like protein n=1 Tax=Ditylenchus destructor TaxID=166010 RepID=A0AAD4NE94_9BILA|nr:ribonuclease P protein subunit p25-like protein [Ditylenchus destructor]
MDNYNILAEDTEPECSMPFPDELSKDAMKFELKKNTKFSGIIARVEKEFQRNERRRMIFYAIGESSNKCIALVEILKSKLGSGKNILYQWNIIKSSKSTDVWTPNDETMDRLIVEKNVPAIFIMISRDSFPAEYQCAGQQSSTEAFPSFLKTKKDQPTRSQLRSKPYLSSRSQEGTQEKSNKWQRGPRPRKETVKSDHKQNNG